MTLEPRRGGIVLDDGSHLFFVPAHVAEKVAPIPDIARVPCAQPELVGIALHEGAILPVVAIGPARAAMLVISYMGEPIGLVGATVVATGSFEAAGDGASVRHDGRIAKPLDLPGIYARMQAGSWAGRPRA